jgi:hypothetical protein
MRSLLPTTGTAAAKLETKRKVSEGGTASFVFVWILLTGCTLLAIELTELVYVASSLNLSRLELDGLWKILECRVAVECFRMNVL